MFSSSAFTAKYNANRNDPASERKRHANHGSPIRIHRHDALPHPLVRLHRPRLLLQPNRPRRPPARRRFRRLRLPRPLAPFDQRRRHRFPLEHRAWHKSKNHPHPESDRQRQPQRNRSASGAASAAPLSLPPPSLRSSATPPRISAAPTASTPSASISRTWPSL